MEQDVRSTRIGDSILGEMFRIYYTVWLCIIIIDNLNTQYIHYSIKER